MNSDDTMQELTVTASELLEGDTPRGFDGPIYRIKTLGEAYIDVWGGSCSRCYGALERVAITRPSPAPKPDPLTELREWAEQRRRTIMATTVHDLSPIFILTQVAARHQVDLLLAKIAELEQR